MAERSLHREFLRGLLAPCVRFCLRRGLKLQDVVEIAKEEFVEHAMLQLAAAGKGESASKVNVMTGVHRKDIAKIKRPEKKKRSTADLVTRIIAQWQTDPQFTTKHGRPRTLSCEGAESEFAQLVGSVSREINHYPVLFELERIAAVKRTSRGLRLQRQIYIPTGDPEEGVNFLSTDVDDLAAAVEQNLFSEQETANLHIKTQYDCVPREAVAELKKWLLAEGSSFHQRMRKYLSALDQARPSEKEQAETMVRVSVGSFSRVDENQKDEFHVQK